MPKNQTDGASEQKTEFTLLYRHAWPKQFRHAVVLPDGKQLVAVPTLTNSIQIWDIATKACIRLQQTPWTITAMALFDNGDLLVADDFDNIHQLEPRDSSLRSNLLIDTIQTKITAMQIVENKLLVLGHDNGSVSIWDLVTNKELRSFETGASAINAMDLRKDGALILGNAKGSIFICNPVDLTFIEHVTDAPSIVKLLVLPDNTIVFGDSENQLWHLHSENFSVLSHQSTDGFQIQLLINMPNGWIGCGTLSSFLLYKPSWIEDYVNQADPNEAKQVLAPHLPPELINIISAYTANITLFSSPKMPNTRACVLAENLPEPKSENTQAPR